MYQHLLIATDGSELANNAVAHGLALAKALGAKVTAVTVTEPYPSFAIADSSVALPIQEYEEAASTSAAKILGEVSAAAKIKGVACDVIHVNDRLPAEGIVETAKAKWQRSYRDGVARSPWPVEARAWQPGERSHEPESHPGARVPITLDHDMSRNVTVFGGTGFLGRRVVRHLREREFTVGIASRHPARTQELFGADDSGLFPIMADIHDEQSVASAVRGAYGVVNAVSLYVEHGTSTFQSVHVAAAARLARLAREAGVQRLMHVSGIGSNAASSSPYIRSRGEGERVVRDAFADATLIRPAVMFGPDDAFLNAILKLLHQLPAYPMFGEGETKLQPAQVEDVGNAIARAVEQEQTRGATIECCGPRVFSYRELLETVARVAGLRPRLIPVPFAAWHALAWMAEALPSPPLTRNQVELMEINSVASQDALGFADLGISPRAIEQSLDELNHTDIAA